MLSSIQPIFPSALFRIIDSLPDAIKQELEEIRVREGRPLEIIYGSGYGFMTPVGKISHIPQHAYMPTKEDCAKLLDLLTNHSVYAVEEELKRGYITVKGGHRVGLSGRTVVEQGKVILIKEITSFNIRMAREIIDAGKRILPYLLDPAAKSVHHTLVISPPQQGKTTLIRDLARLISYGHWPETAAHWPGLKVGVVDERSELAACVKGVPGFDLGPRTDVLDNCPKAEGMMMMIRSLSPDIIVVDEIGRAEDALSIAEATHAGIRLIATAHGLDIQDVRSRPVLKELMAAAVFNRYVVMENKVDFRIYDGEHRKVGR